MDRYLFKFDQEDLLFIIDFQRGGSVCINPLNQSLMPNVNFLMKIPSRDEGVVSCWTPLGDIDIFTDCSQLKAKVGECSRNATPGVVMSSKLVFQHYGGFK